MQSTLILSSVPHIPQTMGYGGLLSFFWALLSLYPITARVLMVLRGTEFSRMPPAHTYTLFQVPA